VSIGKKGRKAQDAAERLVVEESKLRGSDRVGGYGI
jgi:hypothetical protein